MENVNLIAQVQTIKQTLLKETNELKMLEDGLKRKEGEERPALDLFNKAKGALDKIALEKKAFSDKKVALLRSRQQLELELKKFQEEIVQLNRASGVTHH